MNTVMRTVSSLAAIGGYSFVNGVVTNTAAIEAAKLAATQLQPIDQPVQQTMMQMASGAHVSEWALAAALGVIWYKPIKNVLSKLAENGKGPLAALFLASALALTAPLSTAQAYYNARDNQEWVNVPPNSTAFLIPETGNNKDGQAAFMSADYLLANKVPAKSIQIPHRLLINPLLGDSNMYVPAAKVYLFDRTPFMREWVGEDDRGSSNKKEDFRVETQDSIGIRVGIVISASVTEENAHKFAYNFGVKQQGNIKTNDPATTFASVLEGRSLADVMDTNVRGMVQRGLAREFGSRPFDKCIQEKVAIMDAVEKEVITAFAAKGITIDYVGYATDLKLEQKIQDAVDNVVIATRKAAELNILKDTMPVQMQQAEIEVKLGMAEAFKNGKWPNVPNVMLGSTSISELLNGMFGRAIEGPSAPMAPRAPAAPAPALAPGK